jgi:hypothetical protein
MYADGFHDVLLLLSCDENNCSKETLLFPRSRSVLLRVALQFALEKILFYEEYTLPEKRKERKKAKGTG